MNGFPSIGKRLLALLAGIALLAAGGTQAAGLLTPADGSLLPLEIRDHQVQVTIEDGYAITAVEQHFHNPHDRDLEAVYSFPVPEKGSVAEFTLPHPLPLPRRRGREPGDRAAVGLCPHRGTAD